MNAMLANKYLAEGNLERAVPLFEELSQADTAGNSALYALLVCYALELRCTEVVRTAQRITAGGRELDTRRIRGFGHRFSGAFIAGVRERLGGLCRQADARTTACNRLVLAELLGDLDEAARCCRTLQETEPDWNVR